MSDIHIDDFYRDSAKALLQLFSCFPKKTTLFVEDIAGPDTPDEFGLHSERHQACFAALIWLAEAGYLSYLDTIRQEALDQVVLTHKAFTLLTALTEPTDNNSVPPSLAGSHQSNAAILRQTLKQGSSGELAAQMQRLLNQSRDHA